MKKLFGLITIVCLLPAWQYADGKVENIRLVLLPDIQNYTAKYPQIFLSQTKWISENADSIDFVLQQGDITNNNSEAQWENAVKGFAMLEEKNVPFTFVSGNHDIGEGGKSNSRDTRLMNQFLPYDKCHRQPTFGGAYEEGKVDNTYHLFSVGRYGFLILSLEFAPRNSVLEWATEIVRIHPDRNVIINTHAYLYSDELRMGADTTHRWLPKNYGLGQATGEEYANNGQEIWEKLASRYPNILMVVSGHVLNDGAGRLESRGKTENKVYQMLANYQTGVKGSVHGGSGFLRIVDIDPDKKIISVQTYSPYVDAYKLNAEHCFLFPNVELISLSEKK